MNNNSLLPRAFVSSPFVSRIVLSLSMALAAIALPSQSLAQIAGHNVIAVHGLIITDLVLPPSREDILNRRAINDYWVARSEGFLNWSGAERLEGGIAEIVFEQAKEHAASGLCQQGCVLVTHSTGDLVARYFMEHQAQWLSNAGYEPLNIVATIDMAGAGGGTDLADIAVGAANSENIPLWMKLAAGAVLGLDLDITDYDELGVVLDLTTSGARNHAMAPKDVPRLRFSVNGGNLPTSLFIRGADDTVLPAHSTCGASAPDAVTSCSRNINYEGKLTSSNGPSQFLHNHFPILMAENYDHFNLTADEHRGRTTIVLNNFTAGFNVDFATYTRTVTRKWWQVWKETGTWKYVTGSDSTSFSRLIYDTLNN